MRSWGPAARLTLGSAVVFAGLALASTVRLSPGGVWSMWLGGAAAVLIAFESMYPVRRKLMARPFGTARGWLRWHVGAGLAACVLVLVHEGLRSPAGTLGWALLASMLWSTVAGLSGSALQARLPPMLLEIGGDAPFETIRSRVGELRTIAERIVEEGSDRLRRFYVSDVGPWLDGLTPAWTYLTDVHAGRERRLAPFHAVRPLLADADRERLQALEALLAEKLELDARYSVQRVLRYSTLLHAPVGIALLGLIATHLFAVWRFYGTR
jgi:hypothetical protein